MMMKARAMTTKIVVALFISITKQCRYYNHAGYKILVFKFISKGNQKKFELQIMETAGPHGRPLEYNTACMYYLKVLIRAKTLM